MKTSYVRAISGLLFALVSAVGASTALAQDIKIGVIRSQRLLSVKDSALAKAATEKLEQEFEKRNKEIVATENALRDADEKFRASEPTLSPSQRSARMKELEQRDKDLRRKKEDFQKDFNYRNAEETQQLYEKANKAIEELVKAEKYDLILDSQQVLHFDRKHDITDKVLKILNGGK